MRSVSSELQQDESFKVKGVAFWGSRTKGLAKATSDLDMAVFYDGSEYPTDYYIYQPEEKLEPALKEGVKAKSDHIKAIRQKAASLVAGKVPTKESIEHLMDSICPVDISSKNLDYLLDTYRHDTQTDIGSVQKFELVSLFFPGIGDGLYQARSYVLDKLGNDDVLFAHIMNDLSSLDFRLPDQNALNLRYIQDIPRQ
ncbi:nucleotidyltransferase domain-containing protein [Candidatus Gottesmanbacteria bacterium]|nr:nucleotidyltransferase domain-containing protein [Candidatus Gottesmanbacteria bacterium]